MVDQLAPIANSPFVDPRTGRLTQYGRGIINELLRKELDQAGNDASALAQIASKGAATALLDNATTPPPDNSVAQKAMKLAEQALHMASSDEGLHLAQKAYKLAVNNRVRTGDIRMTGVSTVPDGWLDCDGSAVSRTTYADLFNAIGTAFGVGDGSTTFNVPDFDEHVPYGSGTESIGATVGSNEIDLEHSHDEGTLVTGASNDNFDALTGATSVATAAHTHAITGSTGDALSTTQDIRQASLVVRFIIKV